MRTMKHSNTDLPSSSKLVAVGFISLAFLMILCFLLSSFLHSKSAEKLLTIRSKAKKTNEVDLEARSTKQSKETLLQWVRLRERDRFISAAEVAAAASTAKRARRDKWNRPVPVPTSQLGLAFGRSSLVPYLIGTSTHPPISPITFPPPIFVPPVSTTKPDEASATALRLKPKARPSPLRWQNGHPIFKADTVPTFARLLIPSRSSALRLMSGHSSQLPIFHTPPIEPTAASAIVAPSRSSPITLLNTLPSAANVLENSDSPHSAQDARTSLDTTLILPSRRRMGFISPRTRSVARNISENVFNQSSQLHVSSKLSIHRKGEKRGILVDVPVAIERKMVRMPAPIYVPPGENWF